MTSMAGGRQGIFNFEGGCYAKMHQSVAAGRAGNLRHHKRFGTVLENVVFDPETRMPDFDDDSRSRRTRAPPIRSNSCRDASRNGHGGHPRNVMMSDCRRLRGDATHREADA